MGGGQREAPSDLTSDEDKTKSGKHSLISAAFVQIHSAIGTGILLFPYAFWAFGGPVEAVAAQLVSLHIMLPQFWLRFPKQMVFLPTRAPTSQLKRSAYTLMI